MARSVALLSKGMRASSLGTKGLATVADEERIVGSRGGERTACHDVSVQLARQRAIERHPTCAALALGDEQHAVAGVDVPHPKSQGFAEANAGAVHHEQQRAQDDATTAATTAL
jgi:hypothetical protein